MIQIITPFTALTDGNRVQVNAIKLTNFFGYDFSPNAEGTVEYAIGYFNENENSFTSFQNVSIQIPSHVIANWGNDDSVIVNYIVSAKNYS